MAILQMRKQRSRLAKSLVQGHYVVSSGQNQDSVSGLVTSKPLLYQAVLRLVSSTIFLWIDICSLSFYPFPGSPSKGTEQLPQWLGGCGLALG